MFHEKNIDVVLPSKNQSLCEYCTHIVIINLVYALIIPYLVYLHFYEVM